MLKVKALTIFPEAFDSFCDTGLISKSIASNLISISTVNIRDFSDPPHNRVDDTPYGGGAGMVMQAEPIVKAVESVKKELKGAKVICTSASGKLFTQREAEKLSKERELIFISGRYEGIDQRAIDSVVDEEFSIGDYVLMGGEVASMVMIEAVSRLLPGVLGNSDSTALESFNENLLEAPQYTKPREFRGLTVPEVLLSGDHKRIAKWRKEKSVERTKKFRPELLCNK